MPTDRPKASAPNRIQGHLFEKPSPLLTIGQVEALFCDRLNVHRSTFYESHRDWLPIVYTRVRPVPGTPGAFVKGSPRLRTDVAHELVEIAAAGLWPDYVTRQLLRDRPHLYPREERRQAA